jgi:hypothetical protein
MTIGPFIDMRGAVDIHVHSEPDVFPRIGDDVMVCSHAAELGLRAIVLKCHSERTTSRAYLTNQLVPGIQVLGGIVLNRAVGGINPAAVESALELGAKQVWMPTVDAANHAAAFGSTGAYDKQRSTLARAGDVGIRIIDEAGALLPEVYEVLDLIAARNVILGTCHLSREEIHTLVPAAFERGVQKVLITHPYFKVPGFEPEDVKAFTDQGAYAEFGYCTVSPMWGHAPLSRVVETIKQIGPERAVLMSDAGQRHNPMPAESLRVFAQSVHESGISEAGIERMIKQNPWDLLDLGPLAAEPVVAPATDGAVPTVLGVQR